MTSRREICMTFYAKLDDDIKILASHYLSQDVLLNEPKKFPSSKILLAALCINIHFKFKSSTVALVPLLSLVFSYTCIEKITFYTEILTFKVDLRIFLTRFTHGKKTANQLFSSNFLFRK